MGVEEKRKMPDYRREGKYTEHQIPTHTLKL
jgi:hypothetical protein